MVIIIWYSFFCCIFLLAVPLLRKFRLQCCHHRVSPVCIRYDRILQDGSGTISSYAYLKSAGGVSGILIMYIRYQVITMRTSSSTGFQIDGSTNAPHTFVNSYLRVRRVTQNLTNAVITNRRATYLMLQCRASGSASSFRLGSRPPLTQQKLSIRRYIRVCPIMVQDRRYLPCSMNHSAGSGPSSNYSEISR